MFGFSSFLVQTRRRKEITGFVLFIKEGEGGLPYFGEFGEGEYGMEGVILACFGFLYGDDLFFFMLVCAIMLVAIPPAHILVFSVLNLFPLRS